MEDQNPNSDQGTPDTEEKKDGMETPTEGTPAPETPAEETSEEAPMDTPPAE